MKKLQSDTMDFWQLVGSSKDTERAVYENNRLLVPTSIQLQADELVWNPIKTKIVVKDVDKDEDLTLNFARLISVESASILDFARKWGVLGLCEHGLPFTHNQPSIIPTSMDATIWCQPTGKEPIEDWRKFARIVKSMLALASHINRGDVGSKEDWIVLGVPEKSFPTEIKAAELLIEKYANVFLDLAGIRPRVQYAPAYLHISYPANGSLFGALSIRLVQNVVRTHGPIICASCGNFYEPPIIGRRPRAEQRNYCFGCGREAAQRDSQRDYRKRQKAGK
jgi:hypothetical protein